MTRILFISDAHYGLKSGGFDRTQEIHSVMTNAVHYAIKKRVDLFVHGGDLGHTSNPSSYIHGLWVDLFLKLEGAGIESRFMLGNHDAIHREGHSFGSLAPLAELNLSKVKPVVEPDYDWVEDSLIVYLPFISRANIPGKVSIDQYLEDFVAGLGDQFEEARGNAVAFTHLNPSGAEVHDDFILRPVEAKVPDSLFKTDIMGVFSGHIHRPQKVRSNPGHWVVGAPVVTDFGDLRDKRFLLIDIAEDDLTVTPVPSGAMPLVQLEYDFVDHTGPITFDFDPEDIEGAGVKVKLRLTEDQRESVDLEELNVALAEAGAKFIRKITPTIVRRDERETVLVSASMSDREAVKHWVKVRKPSNPEAVIERALRALEEAV